MELIHRMRNEIRPVGYEKDFNVLCGNGAFHAERTNDNKEVDCPECITRMKTHPSAEFQL